ncbi:restriction endonuclease subunit S [Elizabethkingia anophelis]|uniref:restriction endonuclease subunit S n=1 Tax=Elizabethkingia anophelis TaxID=1117645 RepID=UPI00162AA6BF|nr:restriction endonuclease subunit S [Elizabethkingia anophelis]
MENKKLKVGNVPPLRFPGFEGEWKTKKLGEIADKVNSGKTPLGGEAVYTKEGILFIRSQNVNNDRLELDNSVFIPESVNNQMKNSIVKPNDILLNITGASLGRSCVVSNDFKIGNVNQHVCIIRLSQQYNPRFIQPIFSSNKGQIIFNNLQTGSGREGLNFESIKGIKLFTPILDEQQKIASFLSLIDARIQTQNKMIEQLETLIKGLSEKIFSRKIRFVEFTGDWKVKRLGEIFYSEKGKGLSKDKLTVNGKYECLLYGELYTKYKEVIFNVVSKTNEEDGLKSQIGDLLIPSSTTTTGIDLANVTAINKENVLLGGDITVLRSKEKINNIFYAYYLSNYKKEEIANYTQGSTIVHLYYNHMKNMEIDFPSLEEQTKIARFLSSIDAKIETEKNILDKYHSQKQYLLQNLFI